MLLILGNIFTLALDSAYAFIWILADKQNPFLDHAKGVPRRIKGSEETLMQDTVL